eukprot:TRINITY_DN3588_c0_g2_i1.p2 TRINITY_DN3588_c0_g2~~TRINITY_DN3588_c0_g2_i1.p2  ORF type:complete len:179 (+),score=80.83 TRINITY_DN3588_c0_g2_i1:113-649(+)
MSGAGRKHRAKHLCQVHNDDTYELQEGEMIVRLLEIRGSHYRVVDENAVEMLVRLPAKFNRVVWIKKDDFIVVIRENDEEDGVCGLITHRLSPKQIKQLTRTGNFPEKLLVTDTAAPTAAETAPQTTAAPQSVVHPEQGCEEEEEEESDDPWLRGNPNVAPAFDDDEEEDEECEEGEE